MGEGTSQLTQKCSQVQVNLWMPRKYEQVDTVIGTLTFSRNPQAQVRPNDFKRFSGSDLYELHFSGVNTVFWVLFCNNWGLECFITLWLLLSPAVWANLTSQDASLTLLKLSGHLRSTELVFMYCMNATSEAYFCSRYWKDHRSASFTMLLWFP